MSVAIFGGTGFVGRHVAREALKAGMDVTVVSRSSNSTNIPGAKLLVADIFDPDTYGDLVASTDAVVHSVGSIMDNPEYKALINEPLGPSTFMKLLKSRFMGSNPFSNSSFQRLNLDSAVTLADAVASAHKTAAGKVPFVYMSAEDWNPLADKKYIRTKRAAENAISAHSDLRPILFRPGFIYDSANSVTSWPTLKSSMTCALKLSDKFATNVPMISVQTLARAIVEAIQDPDVEGVVGNDALRRYETLKN